MPFRQLASLGLIIIFGLLRFSVAQDWAAVSSKKSGPSTVGVRLVGQYDDAHKFGLGLDRGSVPASQAELLLAQAPNAVNRRTIAKDTAFRRDFATFLQNGMVRFPSIPALSVAVVHGDRPVMIAAFGAADRESKRRANISTRFYIASSTKSFVALALARLAEKGDIDLDWTLADLAPGIAFASGVQPERVTLRHLLSHSHGLSGDALQFRLAYSGDWDEPTLWRLLATVQPNAKAPLGTFAYSNLGYNIAALLIERRLKRSWQDIVEKEVVIPLALRDTAARGLAGSADRSAPYTGCDVSICVKLIRRCNRLAVWSRAQETWLVGSVPI